MSQAVGQTDAGGRAPGWPLWLIFVLCLIPEAWLSGGDIGLWGAPSARMTALTHGAFWAGLLHGWAPNYPAQPWLMFVTYGFLHGGLMHFALNMVTLFAIGRPIEDRLGPWRFLWAYTLLLIAGGIGFALMPSGAAPMVGASGALFGLAGMLMAWDWQVRTGRGQSHRPVAQTVAWLVALNAGLWVVMDGQLAWQTHLGGFVGGWLLAQVWRAPGGLSGA